MRRFVSKRDAATEESSVRAAQTEEREPIGKPEAATAHTARRPPCAEKTRAPHEMTASSIMLSGVVLNLLYMQRYVPSTTFLHLGRPFYIWGQSFIWMWTLNSRTPNATTLFLISFQNN